MRTQKEIEAFAHKAEHAADWPKLSGMTYEQGLRDALAWVLGQIEGDGSDLIS